MIKIWIEFYNIESLLICLIYTYKHIFLFLFEIINFHIISSISTRWKILCFVSKSIIIYIILKAFSFIYISCITNKCCFFIRWNCRFNHRNLIIRAKYFFHFYFCKIGFPNIKWTNPYIRWIMYLIKTSKNIYAISIHYFTT